MTENYPDDEQSRLDRPGAFRVNVAAERELFRQYSGHATRAVVGVVAHPTYGSVGWLAVTNPGPNTEDDLRRLSHASWEAARRRFKRRESAEGGERSSR